MARTIYHKDNPAIPKDPTFLDVGEATPRQRELHAAYVNCGSAKKASAKLNINPTTFYRALKVVVKRAADHGWTENLDYTRHVMPGQIVSGISTYTENEDGDKVWIKTKREVEDQKEAFRAFIEELTTEIVPAKPKIISKKNKYDKDIMPTIVIGDAHIGMKADSDSTRGRDFDIKIATTEIKDAIDSLVDLAPVTETALLVNVGDFMHSDNSRNTTTKGTSVDVDTRYEKIMRSAAHTLIYSINKMLTKFKKVEVCIARGNHDSDSAIGVQLCLECYYSKEPRVNIIKQRGFYHFITFGSNLLGVHHGDKIRTEKLASIMPREMPKAWASTTHRAWLVGHFHHAMKKECDNGVIVETFGTLAPPDNWHAGQGYNSANTMSMIIFKREGGRLMTYTHEIEREYVEPDTEIM